MREGSPYEVIAKAEEIAETVSDSIRVAQARQYVLAANMNLRDRPGVIAALARASDAVENCRNYRLIGNFHALAAWADFQSGSLKNCGLHLVNAERALEKMSDTGEPAASAWRNLGLAYSSIGYYEEAESAFGRVLALSDATMWDKGYVQTVVRRALARDHRGDSPGVRETTRQPVERRTRRNRAGRYSQSVAELCRTPTRDPRRHLRHPIRHDRRPSAVS